MKICWLNANPNPNFGGTELHSVVFVKELKNLGFDVFLCTAEGSYVDKHTQGLRKYYLSINNSLALWDTYKLYRILRKEKPDILIANNGKEYPNALLVGRLAGVKVALFRHMERMKNPLVRWTIFKNVDFIFAVSEHVRKNLIREGVPPDKVCVVYNFVDEELFKPYQKPEGVVNVMFVGKVEEGKGVFDLLHAVEGIEGVKLYFVGDGKDLGELKRRAKPMGNRMVFTGYVKDTYKYYALSHVVVIPSKYTEAFPRVAIEALACGCALVVSDVGGIKEAVVEGFNGYVFRAGDVQDLREKLRLAVKNWKFFSKNSVELYGERFSKEKILRKFVGCMGYVVESVCDVSNKKV